MKRVFNIVICKEKIVEVNLTPQGSTWVNFCRVCAAVDSQNSYTIIVYSVVNYIHYIILTIST